MARDHNNDNEEGEDKGPDLRANSEEQVEQIVDEIINKKKPITVVGEDEDSSNITGVDFTDKFNNSNTNGDDNSTGATVSTLVSNAVTIANICATIAAGREKVGPALEENAEVAYNALFQTMLDNTNTTNIVLDAQHAPARFYGNTSIFVIDGAPESGKSRFVRNVSFCKIPRSASYTNGSLPLPWLRFLAGFKFKLSQRLSNMTDEQFHIYSFGRSVDELKAVIEQIDEDNTAANSEHRSVRKGAFTKHIDAFRNALFNILQRLMHVDFLESNNDFPDLPHVFLFFEKDDKFLASSYQVSFKRTPDPLVSIFEIKFNLNKITSDMTNADKKVKITELIQEVNGVIEQAGLARVVLRLEKEVNGLLSYQVMMHLPFTEMYNIIGRFTNVTVSAWTEQTQLFPHEDKIGGGSALSGGSSSLTVPAIAKLGAVIERGPSTLALEYLDQYGGDGTVMKGSNANYIRLASYVKSNKNVLQSHMSYLRFRDDALLDGTVKVLEQLFTVLIALKNGVNNNGDEMLAKLLVNVSTMSYALAQLLHDNAINGLDHDTNSQMVELVAHNFFSFLAKELNSIGYSCPELEGFVNAHSFNF